MPKDKQCCGNCRWAEHDPQDEGNPITICKWVPETAPDSFLHMRSVHMWNDEGTDCPCWKPKEGSVDETLTTVDNQVD